MKLLTKKSGLMKAPNFFPVSLSGFFIILFFSLIMLQSCKKHDSNPPPFRSLDLKLVADNFVAPVTVVEAPDGTKRLFVVDEIGKIWIINSDGKKMTDPFIDITSKMVTLKPNYDERGLLGLAFHPKFKTNGKFYVFYTAPPPPGGPLVQTGNTGLPMTWSSLTRISEFKVSATNSNQTDMSSERVILAEPHPQLNHNGGTIAFGPDGYLYISIGDGGNKNDIGPGHVEDWYPVNAGGNGQDIESNLLGNILRIDVNKTAKGKNYAIPSDNPFVGKRGLDEIYAYGFRNPYRFSFDMGGSQRLFVGDEGQSLYEEIDVVNKGSNYGWNVKEGTHCFNAADEFTELSSCPSIDAFGNPLIDPVIELKNSSNPEGGGITIAVIGGYVYRGDDIPGFQGKYIFGSLSADKSKPEGQVFISNPQGPGLWSFEKILLKSFPDNIGSFIKGFGQGLDGEIYVTASVQLGPQGNTGKVYKLVFAP
jgi:glucose/arabinose dehydrogenase